jgi:hypothetical protein
LLLGDVEGRDETTALERASELMLPEEEDVFIPDR